MSPPSTAPALGVAAAVLLGLALGLKHAFDPDHLAAVGAAVARSPRAGRAVRVGALWGLGHAASVVVVGGFLVASRSSLPPWLAAALEALAGGLLIALGIDLALALLRERVHVHVHEHDGRRHLHVHGHRHGHGHDHAHAAAAGALRALWIGAAHGLAGSAALALLVAASSASRLQGLVFLLAFSLASTVAMTLATASIALPLRLGGGAWLARVLVPLRLLAAVLALATGIAVVSAALTAAVLG